MPEAWQILEIKCILSDRIDYCGRNQSCEMRQRVVGEVGPVGKQWNCGIDCWVTVGGGKEDSGR